MAARVLILPGYGNSGPQHWQSRWEQTQSGFVRVQQHDWENPVCSEWVTTLDEAVKRQGPDVVLVAHSLACLMVAHWATTLPRPIRGALLVAAPDPSAADFPKQAHGFSNIPKARLPFPSIAVTSNDDPYDPNGRGEHLAHSWGSRWIQLEKRGHINGDSGLGDWPYGLSLLAQLQT